MNKLFQFAIVIIPLSLIGCSHIHPPSVIQGRDKHYLTAKTGENLQIPPGVAANGFRNYYPIPERHYPESEKSVNITPPGLSSE